MSDSPGYVAALAEELGLEVRPAASIYTLAVVDVYAQVEVMWPGRLDRCTLPGDRFPTWEQLLHAVACDPGEAHPQQWLLAGDPARVPARDAGRACVGSSPARSSSGPHRQSPLLPSSTV
jgi:hypothetical protein